MEALAAAAISIVAPYLARGAQVFAQETGSQAAGAAGKLAERLRQWWSRDPVAAPAAEHLASDPRKYSPVLGGLLASELSQNEALAAEVQGLVQDIGPDVQVIQRIEVAKGVTGADIDELIRGSVRIEQEMSEAEDVTGLRAKRIGG